MSSNPFRKMSTVLSGGAHRKSTPTGELTPQSSQGSSGSPHSHNRKSLAMIFHHGSQIESSGTDSDTDSGLEDDNGMSKNAAKRHASKQRKREIRARMSIERNSMESEEQRKLRLDAAREKETVDMRARYGDLPLSQSTTRNSDKRVNVGSLTEDMVGQEVCFRARIHHHRNMGQKLAFVMFRQQISTIQGVLVEEVGRVGPLMMHWAEHLRTGNIMRVRGIVQKPAVSIRSASIHHLEVKITHLHTIVKREEPGQQNLLECASRANTVQCPSRCKKQN